ncbi:MAG: acetyl-CoA C-acyltransferase [Myxococcota bacterium]
MSRDRVAIVACLRTPFAKAWSSLNGLNAVDLSTQLTRELLFRHDIKPETIDQIIWGTVIAVPAAPNIAREVALNLGMYRVPGYSVTRACATGLQTVANAVESIWAGAADVVVAGGVDVTSNTPVPHRKSVIDVLNKAQRAKGMDLIRTLAQINPKDLLPNPPSLTERYTGKTMGQHAEEMAQNFNIDRKSQELYSIQSHQKAASAKAEGHIKPLSMTVRHQDGRLISDDNLIRPDMKLEKISQLKPVFDRKNGSITAATSSPLTDGAAAVVVMRESRAKELGLTPKAYVRSYAFPALDPRENMLLGNVYACPEALQKAGCTLEDMDLLEIHEAFAAQVLSNLHCFDSASFFKEKLPKYDVIGSVPDSKINIWGGSMAYGHPFAATGGRMIGQAVAGLQYTDSSLALLTACAAGGLGSAMVLERAS